MNLIKLYTEIQANPGNIRAYRRLIDHYNDNNMHNEVKAFTHLMEDHFGLNSTSIDEKQREDD